MSTDKRTAWDVCFSQVVVVAKLRMILVGALVSAVLSGLAFCTGTVVGQQDEAAWKERMQEVATKFATSCGKAEIDPVYELMIPELKELVDQPILAKFASKVKANLGAFRSVVKVENLQISEDQKSAQADIVAKFSEGDATVKLNLLADKIQGFEVVSDRMENWFDGLDSTDFYQRQGSTFIRHFMNGKADKVFEMCHPALQEIVADGKLATMIDRVRVDMGALKAVKFTNATQEITEESQKVILEFRVECEKANTNCEITIQLIGMKGHLIGFNFE